MQLHNLLIALCTGLGLASAIALPKPQHDGHGGTTTFPPGFHDEPDLDANSTPKTPNARLTKSRHGPFTVSAQGMISNRPVSGVTMPCRNCYIVAVQAGLEYADGSVANVNTGAWLHHMVLSVSGTGHADLVCGMGLLRRARWYASGNERTTMRINGSGNYGLKVGSSDSFSMIVDLMNMDTRSKTMYLTMTYEWVSASGGLIGGGSSSYKAAQVAWLDVTGCGVSAVRAREGKYDLTSPGWTSSVSGPMLYATGHVHDGGIYTTILKNGQEVCRSDQIYGSSPEYIDNMPMEGMPEMTGNAHISNTGACVSFGQVSRGDRLQVLAHYDTSIYPLAMSMPGESPEIMGISRVVIGTG